MLSFFQNAVSALLKLRFFHTLLVLLALFIPIRSQEDAKKPAAHVLMPVYNADKYIVASTLSVLAQNYPNEKTYTVFRHLGKDTSNELSSRY